MSALSVFRSVRTVGTVAHRRRPPANAGELRMPGQSAAAISCPPA